MIEDLKVLAELVKDTAKSNGLKYCSVGFINDSVNVSTSKLGTDEINSHFLNEDGEFR
ncbi:hypothetical protein [Clostridium butyricum]